MLGNSSWVAFTDSLGRGSRVEPSRVLVNLRGEVDVRMTKSADPEWTPGVDAEYPYAGIMMMFHLSGKTEDLSSATGLTLEYRSEGTISLLLAQKGVLAGTEHRLPLPPQEEFTVLCFPWQSFHQPSWVENPVPMNLQSIAGVMFTNSSPEQSTAALAIRQVDFSGWRE